MKSKTKVYVDTGFWNCFVKEFMLTRNSFDPEDGDNRILLENWYQYLYKSNTYIEKISENPDELYMLLLRNWSSKPNGQTISGELIEQRISNPDSEDLNAVFLTYTNHTEETNRFGILNFHTENNDFLKRKELFKTTNIPIKKGSRINWTTLLHHDAVIRNCNSMVFVDPWIIKNDQQSNNNNLFAVLDSILPQSLDCDFHFTLVSEESEGAVLNKFDLNEVEPWINDKKQWLTEEIEKMRPKLKDHIKIEVCYNFCGAFHDRSIITNHMMITIGAGFDAMKNDKTNNHTTKAGKETTIVINYPEFLFDTETYDELIHQTNYCILNQKKKTDNRLLNYHYGNIMVKNTGVKKFNITTPEVLPDWSSRKPIIIKDNSWKRLIANAKDGDAVIFELDVCSDRNDPNKNFYMANNVRMY